MCFGRVSFCQRGRSVLTIKDQLMETNQNVFVCAAAKWGEVWMEVKWNETRLEMCHVSTKCDDTLSHYRVDFQICRPKLSSRLPAWSLNKQTLNELITEQVKRFRDELKKFSIYHDEKISIPIFIESFFRWCYGRREPETRVEYVKWAKLSKQDGNLVRMLA